MLSRFLLSRLLGIGIIGLSLWGQFAKTALAQMGLSADSTLGNESTLVNSLKTGLLAALTYSTASKNLMFKRGLRPIF
jgi:hypothetical protein